MILPPAIADLFSVDHQYGIKATYHALFLCDFKVTPEDCKKILGKCVEFLCNFVGNSRSTTSSHDDKLSLTLVLRIVGNFIALPSESDNPLNEFIHQLGMQNETFSNVIHKILKMDSLYKNELLWIAGNVYQANENYREEIVSALMI